MLELKKIHAGYGEFKVLKGVDISVGAGEIVALIGPNGAGKSTVIKSVFSIADVQSGEVIFRDRDITQLKTHELLEEGISYVNQGRVNFSTLTVYENLLMGCELIRDKEVISRNLESVYKRFPVLKTKKNSLAFSLSGGEQQQLALGRALMQNPSILLMDEPSLGLSPKLQKELFAMLKTLRDDGISLLIVEQNAKMAIDIADRTYLLEDGNIVLSGGKEILKNKIIKNVYLGGR